MSAFHAGGAATAAARPVLPNTVAGLPIALLESLPAAAYICDAEGVLRGYNRRAAELWGREPVCGTERYCGSARLYRTDGTGLPHQECPLVDVLATGVAVLDQEVIIERPDGSRVTALVNINPLIDETGAIIGAINCFLDITGRKRLEEELSVARDILGVLPVAIYTTDADGRVTYFNEAAADFAGRQPKLGEDHWCITHRLFRPDGTALPHDECPMAIALKEVRPVRGVEAIAERPDGTRVPFAPYPTPLFDQDGKLVGAVNMLVDLTALKAGDETRQRLAAIVECSDDAIVSKSLNGVIMSWNAGAERIFGYKAHEVIGKPIEILIPLDRWHEESEILSRIRRGERIEHFETVRKRKDGALINISLTVSPVRDANGRIIGASKIARDITQRKEAEHRMQLLAREVDHRANNLLATIQAIVRLTQAPSMEEFKREIEGRIGAVAKAHKLIADGQWSDTDLRQLASEELQHYGLGDGNRVRLSGPDVAVNPRIGQSLALVLHELATNSAKYGALSSPTGILSLDWSNSESGIKAVWSETGGPPVRAPKRRGFGTGLIEAMVRGDFGGELSFDWRTEGLICTFTISHPRAN
jgi:PAS domain S-box-containing protein